LAQEVKWRASLLSAKRASQRETVLSATPTAPDAFLQTKTPTQRENPEPGQVMMHFAYQKRTTRAVVPGDSAGRPAPEKEEPRGEVTSALLPVNRPA
jgi:hypothetical protein